MAVPPARDSAPALTGPQDDPDTTDPSSARTDPEARSARGRPWQLPLLVGLAVAALAAASVLVWLAQGRSDQPADLQQQRDRVMSQAEQFVLRAGTYGPDLLEGDQMPQYRDRVLEVVTPGFGEDFLSQAALAEQFVAERGVRSDATVSATGVASMDQDSARVFVIAEFTSQVGDDGRPSPLPLRLQVDLVQQDGRWLVDDFDNVRSPDDAASGGLPQPGQGVPTTPSQQPSPSAGSGGGGTGGGQ